MLRTSQIKALFILGLIFSQNALAEKKEVPPHADKKPAAEAPATKAPAPEAKPSGEAKSATTAQAQAQAVPTVPADAPKISATCISCHAADGNTDNPAFPKLSGLSVNYIIKELKEFQKGANGKRNNPVMLTIANQLSDQDMQELAEYYAKQPRTVGQASATNIELGRRIYRAGNLKTGVPSCSGCHGPNGAGNEQAGFPRLSGQNAQYIAAQLHAFKAGDRANDHNGMMQGIAAKMTDEEIEAVSNYVSGLH